MHNTQASVLSAQWSASMSLMVLMKMIYLFSFIQFCARFSFSLQFHFLFSIWNVLCVLCSVQCRFASLKIDQHIFFILIECKWMEKIDLISAILYFICELNSIFGDYVFFSMRVLNVEHNKSKTEERKKKPISINFTCENKMEIEATAKYFVATNITQSFVDKFFDFQ